MATMTAKQRSREERAQRERRARERSVAITRIVEEVERATSRAGTSTLAGWMARTEIVAGEVRRRVAAEL